MNTEVKPQVVVVGAGFGGLRAVRALRNQPVEVTLVDRNNYHLFQPLLYQVATAGLGPTDIAQSVRAILRGQKNYSFRLAEMTGLDVTAQKLKTSTGDIPYDYLVLAVGGETNFFGQKHLAETCFGMKELDEAVTIRNRVLRMFELAVHEKDPEVRRAMLTFIVVGGGPTGVECSGALSELIRLVLIKDYPKLNIKDVRVILLEGSDRLLASFPERLRASAEKTLWRKYVEVRFGALVADYDGHKITLKSGELIPARTVVWTAGVRAISLLDKAGLPQGTLGRIEIEPTLQVKQRPEIFAIGDAAYLKDKKGIALPMVAPVAIQQGELAAGNIIRLLHKQALASFVYKDPGLLATIGRNAAVAQLGPLAFRGFIAWLVWLVVHIIYLIGFRNRLLVLINWMWDYFFYNRAVRLITHESEHPLHSQPE